MMFFTILTFIPRCGAKRSLEEGFQGSLSVLDPAFEAAHAAPQDEERGWDKPVKQPLSSCQEVGHPANTGCKSANAFRHIAQTGDGLENQPGWTPCQI